MAFIASSQLQPLVFLGCFGPQDPIEIKGAPFFPPPKEELTKMQGANMNTIDFSSQKKERLERL